MLAWNPLYLRSVTEVSGPLTLHGARECPIIQRWDIGFKLTLDYGKSTGEAWCQNRCGHSGRQFFHARSGACRYTFVGWFTAVTDGEQLTDAEGKSLKKYDKDEAIILYAVFEANANKVSLTQTAVPVLCRNKQFIPMRSQNWLPILLQKPDIPLSVGQRPGRQESV